MRFVSLRIINLFSYRDGRFEFPLDDNPERNVVLIHGRNGFGKTSFINAMKLLFLGLHPELMYNIRPGWKMKDDEYLFGSGPEWEGAFNRQALREGDSQCGVELRWLEESGYVQVARTWTRGSRRGAVETLTITPEFPVEDDELEAKEQREAFIERRLPKALLPFFIYDAEQVQKIAEANVEGTIEQIERLLDITTTRLTEDALDRVLKKIRSTGNARSEQIRLDQLRNQLEAKRLALSEIETEISAKESDIGDLDYRIRQAEETIERLRDVSRRNDFERSQADVTLQSAQEEMEQEAFAFLEAFPTIAPFVAYPAKVDAALARIDALVQSDRAGLAEELKGILERLPVRLFDEPQHPRPPLDETQNRFLKAKLNQLLQAEISLADIVDDEGHWQIDRERARRLAQMLRQLLAAAHGPEHAERLRKISRLGAEMQRAKALLSDVSPLPEDERRRLEERLADRAVKEVDIGRLREEIGGLRQRISPLNTDIEKLRTVVAAQERTVVVASRNQFGVDIAETLIAATRRYRELLREQRREDIQAAVNRRFKQLMESHGLIAEIRFEKDFRFGYFDKEGRPVGMANISAGMKQLAAQALLWGLKDLADQDCPVVIDTPLARIDAMHQRHLITDYYPAAGRQIIVLPTDSELDREKYALLKPHVIHEIRLSNPTGECTRVEPGVTMFA